MWISPVAVPGRVVCLHSLARLGTGTEHSGKGNRIKKWAFQTHTHTTHTRTHARAHARTHARTHAHTHTHTHAHTHTQ